MRIITIAASEVAALNHKVGDDTMELRGFVALADWLLGQLDEVLDGLWYHLAEQTDHNLSNALVADFDVEKDLIGHLERILKFVCFRFPIKSLNLVHLEINQSSFPYLQLIVTFDFLHSIEPSATSTETSTNKVVFMAKMLRKKNLTLNEDFNLIFVLMFNVYSCVNVCS